MTTPRSGTMQQRVSRLENDVESIYEELGEIKETQKQHGAQLEKITSGLTRVEAAQLVQGKALEAMAAKLDDHDARFDVITANLAAHDATLAGHGVKLDEHGVKLDMILDLLRRN